DSAIAGGVDTTSDAPLALDEGLRHLLLRANRARSFGARAKLFAGFRPRMLRPHVPSNGEPRTGLSMGEHTELMVKEWGI
ncbi:acetyl-CoA C-acyltransferase, partial [Acinetobacter baumannii]